MSSECERLHKLFNSIPRKRFPFSEGEIPENGIYILFEDGENAHGVDRIVRVGTHTGKDQLKSRLKQHFINENKDRSIFRKNIGRALLNRDKDDYLQIWEIDFMKRKNRELFKNKRDIDKEKRTESKITSILRKNFSFKFITIEDQIERMGSKGLESPLIGTVAKCRLCKSSDNWLGKHSPKPKIRENGLWLVQHLKANSITESDKETILNAIKTRNVNSFDS